MALKKAIFKTISLISILSEATSELTFSHLALICIHSAFLLNSAILKEFFQGQKDNDTYHRT